MAKRISKDDTDRFHDYSLYIPTRTIFVGSEEHSLEHGESGTDGAMAERFIKNLHILDMQSEDPITVIMNNIGGDVNHGLAIYDSISSARSHITVKVFGHAMSMGSIILQAADERVMAPNASQMIHYGSVYIEKHAQTAYKISDENKRIDKWMESMYLERIKAKHPLFTIGKLKRLLDHDTFLDGKASVDLGLADKVLGQGEDHE